MDNKPDFIEFERYQLWTPAKTQGGRRGNLRWGVLYGNPRLICWPSSDEVRRPVVTGMNPETFLTCLEMLTKLTEAPDVVTEVILESDRKPRESEDIQASRVISSVIRFGRDEDGIIYIRVNSEGACDEKFKLRTSDWHRFKKADGRLFTPREDSTYQTRAYVTGIRAVMMPYTSLLTKDRPTSFQGNNGNQTQNQQPQNTQSKPGFFNDIV